MYQHRFIQIAFVEAFAQTTQEYDGKFQTLAFMDAHNTDNILFLSNGTGRVIIPSGGLVFVDEAHELIQSLEASFFICPSPQVHQPEIGLPKQTARKRPLCVVKAGRCV